MNTFTLIKNKMSNRVFYSVNLHYRISEKNDSVQQFIISGSVFMELHTRKFLKIALCQKNFSDSINS